MNGAIGKRVDYWSELRGPGKTASPGDAFDQLREVMWKNIGVERSEPSLREVLEVVSSLRAGRANAVRAHKAWLTSCFGPAHNRASTRASLGRLSIRRRNPRGGGADLRGEFDGGRPGLVGRPGESCNRVERSGPDLWQLDCLTAVVFGPV